jgi:hypothetical protein
MSKGVGDVARLQSVSRRYMRHFAMDNLDSDGLPLHLNSV